MIKSSIFLESIIFPKPWKSLIDSAKFIADYNPLSQHLFIYSRQYRYNSEYEYINKCVKIIDDDTFPEHKFTLTVPSSLYRYVIGYSHGLFCLSSHNRDDVIWNPSIRKSVDIVVPSSSCAYSLGFGVCRDTNDPKLVKINKLIGSNCKFKVFTLSSGLWRKAVSKLPDKSFYLRWGDYPVVIDGFIYWFASSDRFNIIVSFDLTIEELKHIYLPDKLAYNNGIVFYDYFRPIYELRKSLAVVQYEFKADKEVYRVWTMDNSVSKSFTEILTVNLPHAPQMRILGFSNNGELIMQMRDEDDDDSVMLVVCEPESERIYRLGISEDIRTTFFVSSYKESLLLHDQPDKTLTDFH